MEQKTTRRIPRRRRTLAATFLALAFAGAAGADAPRPPASADPRADRILAAASGAWTTTGLFGGVTDPGRGSFALQLGWRRAITDKPGLLVEYAADLVPLELAFGTRLTEPPATSDTATVYGVGVAPLGLEARFGGGRLRPYATLRTGLTVFTKPVPTALGTHVNFALDMGGGLERSIREDRWVFLGVELHHLSNGGIGDANPSLNLFALRGGLIVRR